MSLLSKKIADITFNDRTIRFQGSEPVLSALNAMDAYEEDIVAVECEDDFVGVFTKGNFTKNVLRQNLNPKDATLYEVMTLDPPRLDSQQTVKEAIEAMLRYQWDYMPVLDGLRLHAIISMDDIGEEALEAYMTMTQNPHLLISTMRPMESFKRARYYSA